MELNKSRIVKEVIIYSGSTVYPNKPEELRFSANEIDMINRGKSEATTLMLGEYFPTITYDTVQFCIKKMKDADSENADSLNKIKGIYDNRTADDISAIKIVFDDDSFEMIDTRRKQVYYLPLEDENGALFNCDKTEDVYFRGVFDRNGGGLLI